MEQIGFADDSDQPLKPDTPSQKGTHAKSVA